MSSDALNTELRNRSDIFSGMQALSRSLYLLLGSERSSEMIGTTTGGKDGDDSVAVADGRSWSKIS